jgi:hypothetical protein
MQLRRSSIIIFLSLYCCTKVFAQQDKLQILKSTKWKSEFVHTDSNLIELKEIRLLRLNTIEDTLKKHPTWTFEQDSISFRYFFPEMRRNKIALEEKGPFFGNVHRQYVYDASQNELKVFVVAGKRKFKPLLYDVQIGTDKNYVLLKVIDKRP